MKPQRPNRQWTDFIKGAILGYVRERKDEEDFLENYDGVIGVMNYELEADVFWWRGEELPVNIGSAYVPPDEIDAMVKRFKAGRIP